MDWTTVKKSIGTIAPWLAGTLGTPVAGVAVKALCNVFGLSGDSGTPNTLTAALAGATPDQLRALRLADQKHQEFMQQIGFQHIEQLASIEETDRNSARQREEVVKDATPARLAYMIIGGFFAVSVAQLVALMGYPDLVARIPQSGWLLIGNISGYLANEAKSAAAYYYGSNTGSKDKDSTIKAMAGGQE